MKPIQDRITEGERVENEVVYQPTLRVQQHSQVDQCDAVLLVHLGF